MEDLKYPIGKFSDPQISSAEEIKQHIAIIAALPQKLRNAVESLSEKQLDTPYRDGGWTIRQVVHHLPDSHMNSFIRFRLAMTEDNPVIKPYKEALWAQLADSKNAPIESSLVILEGLHFRWVMMLKSLTPEDWKKSYHHPESNKDWLLTSVLALYSWHCNHHLAHITSLCKRMNWDVAEV
jgi:hypothetical protein